MRSIGRQTLGRKNFSNSADSRPIVTFYTSTDSGERPTRDGGPFTEIG